MKINERIRGYLPVVIDIETGGFNDKTDAMLEICAIVIGIDPKWTKKVGKISTCEFVKKTYH